MADQNVQIFYAHKLTRYAFSHKLLDIFLFHKFITCCVNHRTCKPSSQKLFALFLQNMRFRPGVRLSFK